MGKSIGWIVGSLVLAVLVFFGVQLHKKSQNTADRTAQIFIQDIKTGSIDRAYSRLATDLKQGREQYWKDFLGQFKARPDEATLVSKEAIENTFNTYPANSSPERFTYKFQLQNREYLLQIIMYKVQDVWVVGELLGAYK